MRVLVTGGSGVLGRVAIPRLAGAGHEVLAPRREHLDLFDPEAIRRAVSSVDGVMHLATRIPPPTLRALPDAWAENDRLRTEASRLLVDAALVSSVNVYVQPTVAFLYLGIGPVHESTLVERVPKHLESALIAEAQAMRFAAAGRRGVVLRLGARYGPTTGADEPRPGYDAHLHIEDAGAAMAAALTVRSGVYNVVRDGQRASNARFKQARGWRPRF